MRWGIGTVVFFPILPPVLLLLCFVASLLLSPLSALSLLDLPATKPLADASSCSPPGLGLAAEEGPSLLSALVPLGLRAAEE